jgi:hypothetical protein
VGIGNKKVIYFRNLLFCKFLKALILDVKLYRASHIRLISKFILYATKNTNDAGHLIPFIM